MRPRGTKGAVEGGSSTSLRARGGSSRATRRSRRSRRASTSSTVRPSLALSLSLVLALKVLMVSGPAVQAAWSPTGSDDISTVAICAGSGSGVLKGVKADLYLTGEMGHVRRRSLALDLAALALDSARGERLLSSRRAAADARAPSAARHPRRQRRRYPRPHLCVLVLAHSSSRRLFSALSLTPPPPPPPRARRQPLCDRAPLALSLCAAPRAHHERARAGRGRVRGARQHGRP